MLIFDQLRRNDPQLRVLTLAVLSGFAVLLAGLWWVQIVRARDYRENLENQSFRTVRIPAVRGRILDRNGVVLAENRPVYNVSLYLEELRRLFKTNYDAMLAGARQERSREMDQQSKALGRGLSSKERRQFALTAAERTALADRARFAVASNVVTQISQSLQLPLTLESNSFNRHYQTSLVLPYPVATNLSPAQVAVFEEHPGAAGADLEVQSCRVYPHQTLAAHLLGHLRKDDSSVEGENSFFNYRLPDYRGAIGIEAGFDNELHGRAGEKSVLVNNLGFRQGENIWTPAEPGQNVTLTIDAHIQQAAEDALRNAPVNGTPQGAIVVMDVQTGDVLAMASSPTYDPNCFIPSLSTAESERLNDPHLLPQINRATQATYAPGSTFKPIVGLACLEAGLNPSTTIYNAPNPREPNRGHFVLGRRVIRDTAPPGDYDFRRAIMFSSNTYFITNGLKYGIENIVRIGQRLHFGERFPLPTRQESAGLFPSMKRVGSGWSDGDTANLCIGQGYIAVTPLQMAIMTCALANGGKVLWPRLVDRVESADPLPGESPAVYPKSQVRDELGVSARSLKILKDAMRDEVEDAGTGARAFVQGLTICGKTGTAQITNERNQVIDHTTWFISFAPYDQPRYAVVVVIQSGVSGGVTCAPLAAKVYTAILEAERAKSAQNIASR
ncbi:MAG: penicillin-binding transpeptidase domain-containing protein [Verrucomicrobiota bacterium]